MNEAEITKIAHIETLVEEMHKRLFGNGQPGEISAIKHRLTVLERFHWKLIGLAGGLIVLVEAARSAFEALHYVAR